MPERTSLLGALIAGGPHYYPLRPDSTIGGEVYERNLLERLPAQGVSLVLGLPRDHRVADPPAGWEIDVLAHSEGLHWTRAPLVFTPYALRLLRSRRVQLLRGHSVRHTGPALLLARTLARSHVPVVLHHHHLDPRWRRLEAAIAARASAVITVSEHARDELVAAGVPRPRVHVVLQGIEAPPPTAGFAGAWPGGLRLLYLGRLEERKRPALAIDTLAALSRSGVAASLVLAGDGPQAAALRERASGLPVRFLGRVPDAEKWRLYDSADVLLFGSTLEGFGRVVAEAQARGVPVVAANGTATAEATVPGESALLVPPSADAFAAAVRELADPVRRAAMSARAREQARRFDWDACAARVAGIYRSLVP